MAALRAEVVGDLLLLLLESADLWLVRDVDEALCVVPGGGASMAKEEEEEDSAAAVAEAADGVTLGRRLAFLFAFFFLGGASTASP